MIESQQLLTLGKVGLMKTSWKKNIVLANFQKPKENYKGEPLRKKIESNSVNARGCQSGQDLMAGLI